MLSLFDRNVLFFKLLQFFFFLTVVALHCGLKLLLESYFLLSQFLILCVQNLLEAI